MPRSVFFLLEQILPESSHKYRIAESVFTSDGVRTRLTNGAFKTRAEAEADIARREQDMR